MRAQRAPRRQRPRQRGEKGRETPCAFADVYGVVNAGAQCGGITVHRRARLAAEVKGGMGFGRDDRRTHDRARDVGDEVLQAKGGPGPCAGHVDTAT